MRIDASLTECDLRCNKLGEEGWCAVFDALRDNPQNKIARWNLSHQKITPTILMSLAAYMAAAKDTLTQALALLPMWPPRLPSFLHCLAMNSLFVFRRRWTCLATGCAALNTSAAARTPRRASKPSLAPCARPPR